MGGGGGYNQGMGGGGGFDQNMGGGGGFNQGGGGGFNQGGGGYGGQPQMGFGNQGGYDGNMNQMGGGYGGQQVTKTVWDLRGKVQEELAGLQGHCVRQRHLGRSLMVVPKAAWCTWRAGLCT